MTVINTNVNSLAARNAINANQRSLQTAMQSLSTGSRINRASDDSAGISIRENMTTQIKGFDAAVRNANDGISLLQTADSAMEGMANLLQRMRELGVLAQNDTYSSSQRTAMEDEFTALLTEVDRMCWYPPNYHRRHSEWPCRSIGCLRRFDLLRSKAR